MTSVELMDNLADFLRSVIDGHYSTSQSDGTIAVYAGYPPVRTAPDEMQSYIYCLVTGVTDSDDPSYSQATVEIGCSIYSADVGDGWRALANLMEHIRQALLSHRTLKERAVLVLPLRMEMPDAQPYPQWQGRLTATYTIGQPDDYEWKGILQEMTYGG